MITPSLKVIWR